MRHPWLALAAAGLVLLAALWIALKIGRFLLKLAAGLAMLGLIGLLLWYLFLR